MIEMRKTIAMLMLCAACLFAITGCGSTKQLNITGASRITVNDGGDPAPNKTVEITDAEAVDSMTRDFNSLSLRKSGKTGKTDGIGYIIKWFDTDGNVLETIDVSPNFNQSGTVTGISEGKYYWKIESGSVDIEAIDMLFEKNPAIDVLSLTFPDEPSPSVPWYSIGVDAGWGWEQKDLPADKIYAMFGQENELLFAGTAVEVLHDLTAEGFFDTEGFAQSMTVQGWREDSPGNSGPNHPIFQINLFQLDSRLMRTKTGEDAVVAENEVFGVPVTTCWREVKNVDCYYAAFETNGLAVGCTVYTSASQSAEDAKALLSRIVSQCLAPDGGIRLDAANGETGYTPVDSWPQTELLSHIPEPTEGQPIRFHAFPDDYEVVELEGCTSETYEQYISMLQQEGFSAWDGDWGNDASRWDKDGYSVQVSLYNGHMIIAVSTDGLEE